MAKMAEISLSSLKKIEKGEISSFDSFIRVLRTLGSLDVFLPLIEEEQISPSEYYKLVNSSQKNIRKRARGGEKQSDAKLYKEESEW